MMKDIKAVISVKCDFKAPDNATDQQVINEIIYKIYLASDWIVDRSQISVELIKDE